MSKFVVVTFRGEGAADQGARALQELDADGSLTLYGFAVIGREPDGSAFIKQPAEIGPLGASAGSLSGALIGILGSSGQGNGPAQGRPLLGNLTDLLHLGINEGFLFEVCRHLTPGSSAVVAEVREDRVTPLDFRMEALGGVVSRTWRADIEDDLCEREVAACRAELADLKAEFDQARTGTRAKLRARLDEAREKLREAIDQTRTRIALGRREAEARIHALEAQAAKAGGDARVRMERRAEELRAASKRRTARLEHALEQAVEQIKEVVEA